jgi:hypothetical protein
LHLCSHHSLHGGRVGLWHVQERQHSLEVLWKSCCVVLVPQNKQLLLGPVTKPVLQRSTASDDCQQVHVTCGWIKARLVPRGMQMLAHMCSIATDTLPALSKTNILCARCAPADYWVPSC